jgi:hypothetical protein
MWDKLSALWRSIGIGGQLTVALALIGGLYGLELEVYSLGKDAGEKALAVYMAANKIDFSALSKESTEAVAALRKATTEFSTLLANSNSYEEMKSKVQSLTQANKDLSEKYEAAKTEREKAISEYDGIFRELATLTEPEDKATLEEGKSASLSGNLINIGLVSKYPTRADIRVNGLSRGSVETGAILSSPYDISLDDEQNSKFLCRLRILDASAPNSITVASNCHRKEPKATSRD